MAEEINRNNMILLQKMRDQEFQTEKSWRLKRKSVSSMSRSKRKSAMRLQTEKIEKENSVLLIII